jgi:putative oxidoreductase
MTTATRIGRRTVRRLQHRVRRGETGRDDITPPAPTGAATDGRITRLHPPERKTHDMTRTHRSPLIDPTTLPAAGVLVLRVVVGITFLLHGLDKLSDLAAAEQFFASLGIPAPGLMAPFVAVTETVGGVLLVVGLATPLVAAALAIDMLVALLTAHVGQGFFVSDGGIELALLLGGASLGIALAGAGRFSLDASFALRERVATLRYPQRWRN